MLGAYLIPIPSFHPFYFFHHYPLPFYFHTVLVLLLFLTPPPKILTILEILPPWKMDKRVRNSREEQCRQVSFCA